MRHKILSSSRTSGVGGRVEKNFVAAAVFSVSYFLNVVEEFRSCCGRVVEEFRSCFCFLGKLFLNVDEEFRSCLSKLKGKSVPFLDLVRQPGRGLFFIVRHI